MEITLRIIVINKTIVNVKVKGVNALVNVIHICDIMYSYLSAGTRGGIEMTEDRCAGNDEDCFQEALGIMVVWKQEMDACPNCTESKACDKHRNMFDEELK